MAKIPYDLSNLPSDVALVLSQQEYTRLLADDLSAAMMLSEVDRDLLHQEIVGTIAQLLDSHLP